MGPLGSGGIMSLSPDFSNGSAAPSQIGGTSAQSTFQQPSVGQSILPTGASTYKAPAAPQQQQQQNNSGSYQQQWQQAGHAGTAPVGYHGESSGGGAPALPNLDELYNPIFANYDKMQGQIQNTQGQYQQDLQNSYNQNMGLIPGYEQTQGQQINLNETNLQNQIQNANDTAARNYQWANQAAGNQYGFNGAFLGANSIAQTEMQRELGLVGQQGVQGEGQIGQQRSDLSNWGQQQRVNLSNQYMSAKDNLNQYFQQQLFALMNDRNATEAQKAAGKVQLLQDVMNQNNAIQQQAVNFQQQMALYNAQMGQTANTGYTMPSALGQAMQQTQNTIQNGVNPANQTVGFLTGNTPTTSYWAPPSQKQDNDYANQLLGFLGTSNQSQSPQDNSQAAFNLPTLESQQIA